MKAIWNNTVIAESDNTVLVEGNGTVTVEGGHYFPELGVDYHAREVARFV